MSAVVEHGRNLTAYLAKRIILDDDESDTRHGEVLLSTAIDAVVLAHIDRAREDIRRHISNHRHRRVKFLAYLSAIDGVVGCDVEIVGISRNGVVLRNVCISGLSRRSDFNYLTKQLCFLHRLLSPDTSVEISCFLLKEVVGNHTELKACTSTKEDDRIALWNVEQLLEECYCFIYYWLEILSSVADFHQRKA